MKKTISLFGSSHPQPEDRAYRDAYSLGKNLASRGFTIINGGNTGSMEASARGAIDAGGKTIGITFSKQKNKSANPWIQQEIIAETLYMRIHLLIEKSDGIIVLPGGTGTLAELGIAWDLLHKKIIKRPPLIFQGRFWKPVYERIVSSYPQAKKYILFMYSTEKIADFFVQELY